MPSALLQSPRIPGARLSALAARVRAEYLEAPGLLLWPHDAERVLELEPEFAESVLELLRKTGFLVQDLYGRYKRPDSF